MRIVIKKDTFISNSDLQRTLDDFRDFMQEHMDITPEYFVEEHHYVNVPLAPDDDGDLKPTDAYFGQVTDAVYDRYGEFGTDHVILMVHEDNWVFDGIWGTNLSGVYHSYHVELCRYDKGNMANTFGTLYHEIAHCWDSLVPAALDISLNEKLGYDWDTVVHGQHSGADYIRYQENTFFLKRAASYVKAAYEKRRELYKQRRGLMQKLLHLLERKLFLLRQKANRKHGTIKG